MASKFSLKRKYVTTAGVRLGPISTYNKEAADLILRAMELGDTVRAACAKIGINEGCFRGWAYRDEDGLHSRYIQARKAQMNAMADDILSIADDTSADQIVDGDGKVRVNHENINRSRLKVDTRKWLMSKLDPRTYGERLDLNSTVQAGDSLAQLMASMRGTALPVPVQVIATVVDDTKTIAQ